MSLLEIMFESLEKKELKLAQNAMQKVASILWTELVKANEETHIIDMAYSVGQDSVKNVRESDLVAEIFDSLHRNIMGAVRDVKDLKTLEDLEDEN